MQQTGQDNQPPLQPNKYQSMQHQLKPEAIEQAGQPADDIIPSALPAVQSSQVSMIFKIHFYSGESAFKNKLALKPSQSSVCNMQSVQNLNENSHSLHLPASENSEQKNTPEGQPSFGQKREVKSQVLVKNEEGVGESSKRVYEFSRVINKMSTDRFSLMRKMTKGILSISARKYHPNVDIYEIFDEEEIAENIIGLDECRQWKNLMSKYTAKKKPPRLNKKKKGIKRQTEVLIEKEELPQDSGRIKSNDSMLHEAESFSKEMVKKEEEQHEDIYHFIIPKGRPENQQIVEEKNEAKEEQMEPQLPRPKSRKRK